MSGQTPLAWLDADQPNQAFPAESAALEQPNGLLAAGGCLSPQRLMQAYRRGIFPWYGENEPLLWWTPNPRAVLRVGQLHRSRSLQRAWKRQDFFCTTDFDFSAVMDACSRSENDDGVWLSEEMQSAYLDLHRLGQAHSVEIWRSGALIGGIYGVHMGRVFFGESMFSRATNGSKLALWALDELLRSVGTVLLDGQVSSPHLLRMGFELWPRERFLQLLTQTATAEQDLPNGQWKLPELAKANAAHAPISRTTAV